MGKLVRERKMVGRKNRERYWISEATKNEGALRDYVQKKYGSDGFTERGTIKDSVLHDLIRDPDTTMRTKRRAQLALNLREINRSK